jgi:hypothetical protein
MRRIDCMQEAPRADVTCSYTLRSIVPSETQTKCGIDNCAQPAVANIHSSVSK